MGVTSAFEGGSIELVSIDETNDAAAGPACAITLRLTADPACTAEGGAEYKQWFSFRVTGARGRALKVVIENTSEAMCADGLSEGYFARGSYDGNAWTPLRTSYREGDGVLTIEHTPASNVLHIAAFAPYTLRYLLKDPCCEFLK